MTRELISALVKSDRDNEYLIYTPTAASEDLASFTNVTYRVVPWRRFWTQTVLPRAVSQDELDVFWSPSNVLPRHLNCKSLATIHDLAFMRFPRCYRLKDWFLSWLTARRAAQQATGVITVSRQTKQDLIRYFNVAPDKIKIVYCALPHTHQQASQDEIRHRYSLPNRFLLVVGRIEPRKNPLNIVRAFGSIARRNPDMHLVFVGPAQTSHHHRVISLVNKLKLNDRIHFLGFVPIDDLFTTYQMADVLLFPSLYEGFGIPILEAWAARTPVVTSDIGAMKEVAESGAILVDPFRPEDIANKVQQALDDSALRSKYIQAGLDRLQDFSWTHSAKKLKNILESL